MPELPEVEITARNLRAWAVGHEIDRVEVDEAGRRIFRPESPRAFATAVAGYRVGQVTRVGKQLLVGLEPASARAEPLGLISHLGMTGKWLRRESGELAPSHSRARLHLASGAVLHFRDPRLFGRLRLVPGARFDEVPELAALGPDPLEEGISVDRLARELSRRRTSVKVALLDQSLIPGVGNIHASESLFRARLDPRRRANELSRKEVERLARAVRASLEETIEKEAGPEVVYLEDKGASNPFLVYGRAHEACPRCGRAIVRVVQGQRSTFFCRRCQR
ncbi:MAG TPA: bifunctional DNA-formamidopyrimidine glycosylase/DNA-(apurinic or apyrimidinic site) lyase [Anaeromyxobacteraceae bacterium]|nr:bifunctional DNA-formamidopyrimidine glycosylase/DNA-(apurinic or apyrimidinic site) lyase [Anaeromyxobacteraceae bacterium]